MNLYTFLYGLTLYYKSLHLSREWENKTQTGEKICKDLSNKGLLSKTHTKKTLKTQQENKQPN